MNNLKVEQFSDNDMAPIAPLKIIKPAFVALLLCAWYELKVQ